MPVVIITDASRGLGAAGARWLALYAPGEFSGKFFVYDDPRVSRAAREAFGDRMP